MEDKISIIVPVYNVELQIRKCIKSLINQTYKNIEIILIDDESPDNCGKICDAFAKEDDRIKVIHKKNGGVCAARNSGLEVATGDYIGFIDPDDWATSDMFEYLLDNLKKYDADISCCRYFRVIPNKKIYSNTDGELYIYNKEQAIEELVNNFTIRSVFWNKLFKKELFENLKFPVGMIYEGTYLVHKIFELANKIVYLPDPKYYYYKYEKSYVNTITVKNQCDYVCAHIERYNDLNKKYPKLKLKLISYIVKECVNLVEICYKKKREIKQNKEIIMKINDFIKDNYNYILKMDNVNKITLIKLRCLKSLSAFSLFKAHCLNKAGKFIKVINKFTKKLKKKKKNRTEKFGVAMSHLTNEDREIFNKLHQTEIEILDEFVRICKKYELKYFLYGGTLLGAVRHKGFIPWDDDIDIVMPREDYEKFGEYCKTELNDKYFYQTFATDEGYPMLFAKIRLNNTYVREVKWDNKKIHKGIYIDILPLDLFPKNGKFKEKILLEKFNVLNSACQVGKCLSNHIISKILYRWYMLFPNIVLQRKRDKLIRNVCKNENTEWICSFGSHYRPIRKRVLKKEWFEDAGLEMEFEGKMYAVPKGWKEYLIHLFGNDYMKLPPEEERINHFNFYEIKFDTEETRAKEVNLNEKV